MKKFLLGTLVMIAGLLALAAGARAQTGDVMIHINRDFIAGGKTFSAGTYRVYQGSSQTGQWLILRSKETGTSVYLLPRTHDWAFPGQFEAKLTRAGNLYYLSEVVTELGIYTLPAPHALTQMAKKKDHGKMGASGSSSAESEAVTE
jgi:hypothetical protein